MRDKNEKELAKLALQLNAEGTEAVAVREGDAPNGNWELARLGAYVRRLRDELRENGRLIGRSLRLRTVLKSRQGRALYLARAKVEGGGNSWSQYLKELGISRTTACRHMALFTRATETWGQGAEVVLGKLTAGEAYRELGIGKEPPEEQPERQEKGSDRTTPPPRVHNPPEGDRGDEDQGEGEEVGEVVNQEEKGRDTVTPVVREWRDRLEALAEEMGKGGVTWTKEGAEQCLAAVEKVKARIPGFRQLW
jgi:hypothetical protein